MRGRWREATAHWARRACSRRSYLHLILPRQPSSAVPAALTAAAAAAVACGFHQKAPAPGSWRDAYLHALMPIQCEEGRDGGGGRFLLRVFQPSGSAGAGPDWQAFCILQPHEIPIRVFDVGPSISLRKAGTLLLSHLQAISPAVDAQGNRRVDVARHDVRRTSNIKSPRRHVVQVVLVH